MKTGSHHSEANSRTLAPFAGNRAKSIFNPHDHDRVLEIVEALANLRVVCGPKPGLILGRRRAVLVVPYGGSAGSSGGSFRGEYNPAATYSAQDIVVIRIDNLDGYPAGTYVCVKNNPGAVNPPTQPDTGNEFWISLANGESLGNWL